MKAIYVLVSTNKGWIIRQALKGATYISGGLSVKLATFGVAEDTRAAIGLGIAAIVTATVEGGLSFIARKYAVK